MIEMTIAIPAARKTTSLVVISLSTKLDFNFAPAFWLKTMATNVTRRSVKGIAMSNIMTVE
jgi:hypothetical protein